MQTKIKPLGNKILVKRSKSEEVSKGGIIIPDTAKEKSFQAEVLAVGRGKLLENGDVVELELEAGDVVLIGKYSGTELKVDGEDLLILSEDDVLGTVERE